MLVLICSPLVYDFYGKETNHNGTGMTVVANTAMVAEKFCSGSGLEMTMDWYLYQDKQKSTSGFSSSYCIVAQ